MAEKELHVVMMSDAVKVIKEEKQVSYEEGFHDGYKQAMSEAMEKERRTKMTNYTERVDGFQIRDCAYFGAPPEGLPPRFDVVKWYPEKNPHIGTVYHTGKDGKLFSREEMITEHCYSVGTIEWNEHERAFDFNSVGLRWIEEKPSAEVNDMILKFCEEMEQKIRNCDY